MKYVNLLDKLKSYGIDKNDIIKREGYENILENVVIAPWWGHDIFASHVSRIEQVAENTYNMYDEDFAFSFIELKTIGAPRLMDKVLALGATTVKNIIFIGSVGALSLDIGIGDLLIPSYSYNGVGASRYLNDNLEDDFEIKYYPNIELTEKLLNTVRKNNYPYHYASNYSVDTILGQFPHLQHMIDLGAKAIEMETSVLFKAANMVNIPCSALLCVSDNTLESKSLYQGRREQEREIKNRVRKEIIPKLVIDLFKTI